MDHFPVCYRFKNVAARDFIHDKGDHIDDSVCDNGNVDTFIMVLVSGLVRTQYAMKYYFKHDCAHPMWNLNLKWEQKLQSFLRENTQC